MSNWTELNIWEYIDTEEIPVVPLYFSKKKSSTDTNHQIFLLDDNRYRLKDGDKVITEKVRFRTLGCYPLTAATISNADSVKKIILELKSSAVSERSGRLIDFDKLGSMELKKRGYF